MKWFGFFFLTYAALCVDLSGQLQRISPLAPLALDVIFLGLILGGKGAGAVCGAAVTGLLAAFVLGNNPALGLMAAATCAMSVMATRSSTTRQSVGRMLSAVVCVGGYGLVRGLDRFTQAPLEKLLDQSFWVFVAPSGVMIGLVCVWLVTADCVTLRNRQRV